MTAKVAIRGLYKIFGPGDKSMVAHVQGRHGQADAP